MQSNLTVAVLFGGVNEEREVSIASASRVIPALRSLGHRVVAIDLVSGRLAATDEERVLVTRVAQAAPAASAAVFDFRENLLKLDDVDLVFLALHGGAGEDGRIQAILNLAGVAFTGSSHISSAVAMDKDISKRLFRGKRPANPP